jgi:UDP-N-acetylmuramoylalanine--D-glutamate ligase
VTRLLVVGFGVTGRAAARAGRADGSVVVVIDDRRVDGAPAVAAEIGVELVVGPDRSRLDELLRRSDLVVASPGVPIGNEVFARAARHGVEVVSEIELAARLLEARPAPRPRLVAITGTNGKTTVTSQVCDALLRSGRTAVAAGNIGPPLIEAVSRPSTDVIVAEVSSFQLQLTVRFHPEISCWLNLAPDHLDWHPSYDHYRAAKARIWANQADGDTVVVNADDAAVVAMARHRPTGSRLVTFSTRHDADWYERAGALIGPGGTELLAVAELPRSLPHDRANALATAAVASSAGATLDGIRTALREMDPGPHRVELVGVDRGVSWYDDSKATTPASVLAATAGFGSVVLIAGGRNKGLDLGALAATAPPVHAVVAIGEAAAEIMAAFAGRAEVTEAGSMAAAVAAAREASRPGDAVVLSPGCASFDWYGSYAERGDHFASLVRQMFQREQMLQKERDRC